MTVVATHCITCQRATAHSIVARYADAWTETNSSGAILDVECSYDILRCSECRSAQLRIAQRIEQLSDDFSERFIPPHPARVFPSWAAELDAQIRGLLEQTHLALANGYLWLVAMGGRTLLDMFTVQRIGDVGPFKKKLDQLQAQGFLSVKDRPVARPRSK
jgi:hypothetical protein